MIKNVIRHLKSGTFIKTALRKVNSFKIKLLQHPVYYYYRDFKNIIRYGIYAPRYAERIWINPLDCHNAISTEAKYVYEFWTRRESAMILHTWPDIDHNHIVPLIERESIKSSFDHWAKGVPWETTGEYRFIEMGLKVPGYVTNFSNIEEALERFRKLDLIFEQVSKEKRLKTRKEINSHNFREKGGIYIHIGPKGELVLGDGFHRFSIALINEIDLVPAQLGCVHIDSLKCLHQYRKK